RSPAALWGEERRGASRARPVEMSPRLAPQVEDVLEALVRHERRASAAALEERVRGDRRAVREAVDLPGADCLRCRDHGLLLPGGGRHLGGPNRAVVDEYGVRERPADVDTERAHPLIRP